jgi:hypothetical protein
MSAFRRLGLCSCVLLLGTFAGQPAVASEHPTPSEKQDVLAGIAYTEARLPVGHFREDYPKFSGSAEFSRRSKYFRAGADYRTLLLADRARQTLAIDRIYNDDGQIRARAAEEEEQCVDLCSLAWNRFEHDLEAIAMTPESFGKVVENDDLSRIMADNPYGFRD